VYTLTKSSVVDFRKQHSPLKHLTVSEVSTLFDIINRATIFANAEK